ncbi:MAG: DUF3297 family protein, partial [Sphingomonadaceae bacterium]|nr:DUF3297 family protein [Sphingomonadaceae bacterium]
MTDTPPDRLSIDPSSPHFNVDVLRRGVGIRFRGVERRDIRQHGIGADQPVPAAHRPLRLLRAAHRAALG